MTRHRGYGVMRRVLFVLGLIVLANGPAGATSIERVISPGGIEAWLVRQPSVPLVAMDFAMIGGANEDPADKAGVAHLVASTIDEGAGDLDANAYHQRLEDHAIELSFSANRDHFRGSLRTLSANRDLAFDTLRLSLTAPRFDEDSVERVRTQILADLRRATTSPGEIASEVWWHTAFAGHPYGRAVHGTLESMPRITIAELKAYAKRVFARATLKIAIVGDIDAATAGLLIDKAFGGLPEQPELGAIPSAGPQGLGRRIVVDLDVPQSVIMFGGPGVARNDPDFFAAYLVNHILGGGAMSSRLYTEVREKRGLAYGVSSSLVPLAHAQLISGSTATRADRTADTLEIIEREMKNLAENGPTDQELAKTKSFLKGSYGLYFDTSSKIAAQLVQIQLDKLGIDYIDRRNAMIDAVTRADAQRLAKRLLDGKMLITVVGKPQGVTSKDVPAAGSGG
jgi:zinc protease